MGAPPPSREWWAVEGELHGHSVAETIAYLSHCADFEDEQQDRRRLLRPSFVSLDLEPRLVSRLRRIFGR